MLIKMSYDPASFIEGVPVKVSEKFRPPRKVSLISSCNYHVDTECLTTEYDLSLENETLNWLQNLKQYKESKRCIRDEKIRKYNEEKEKKLEEIRKKQEEEKNKKEMETKENNENEDLEAPKEVLCIKRENDESMEKLEEDESKSKDGEEVKVNGEVCLDDPAANGNNISQSQKNYSHIMEEKGSEYNINNIATTSNVKYSTANSQEIIPSNISYHLQTPAPNILIPTQCSHEVNNDKSSIESANKINFADFEGDPFDPFDSVALKSINDMEELAAVLHSSTVEKPQLNSSFNYQRPSAQFTSSPYTCSNTYLPVNHTQTNMPLSLQPRFGNFSASTSGTHTSVPFSAKYHSSAPSSTSSFQQWNTLSSSHCIPKDKYTHVNAINYLPPTSLVNTPTVHNMNTSADGSSYHSNIINTNPLNTVMHNSNTGFEVVSKRQDLEDFYSRYYSNKRQPYIVAKSGDTTPINNPQKNLCPSHSVPDLTNLEDSEVSTIVNTSDFPTNFNSSRPSSTGLYETSNKSPLRNHQSLSEKNQSRSRLSDPFTELTEEAQNVVQNMAEMGFPRPRVARAVQKLGTDHKKLLEVLLTLQSFEDSGADECFSERAFYFFMGDVERVKEFLQIFHELQNLGFEEERITELLFKHYNSKEKCLEELIS